MGIVRGSLDIPGDGATVEWCSVEIAGWALSTAGQPRAVIVAVNGDVVTVARLGVVRADVGEAFPEDPLASRSGWRCVVDLDWCGDACVVVEASTLEQDGTITTIGRSTVWLVPPRPPWRMSLDHPAPNDSVAGALTVDGWCDFGGEPPGHVSVSLDGGAVQRARLGTPRPDTRGLLGRGDAGIEGFETLLALPTALAGRTVTVVVTATSASGQTREVGAHEVKVLSPPATTDDERQRASRLRARQNRYVGQTPAREDGPLRLLVATHTLTLGGAQRWLSDLLTRFAGQHEPTVQVMAALGGPQSTELAAGGREVVVTGRPGVDTIEGYEGHLETLAAWLSCQPRPDVVLVNTFGMFAAADLAHRFGLPTVWAIHESYDIPVYWIAARLGMVHPYVRERAVAALRETNVGLFVADATRRQYARALGGPSANLWTIPGAIEQSRFDKLRGLDQSEARRLVGLPAPPVPVLLCLGTVDPRKGLTTLARAFLEATAGSDAVLAIVGEDPNEAYGIALRDYLDAADSGGRVRLYASTADPLPWLRAADVLVSASDVESLPLVLLEAMAAGTPTLATAIFGVPELIEDGKTGWLVPANDEAALVGGIRRALSSSTEERRRIAHTAGQLVRRRHDLANYSAQVWDIISAVATSR